MQSRLKIFILTLIGSMGFTPMAFATDGCIAVSKVNNLYPIGITAKNADGLPAFQKGQIVFHDTYIAQITKQGRLISLGAPTAQPYAARDLALKNCHVGIIRGVQGQSEFELVLNNNLANSNQMIVNAYQNKLELRLQNDPTLNISEVGMEDAAYDMVHNPKSACAKVGQGAINGSAKMANEIDSVCVWGKPIQ